VVVAFGGSRSLSSSFAPLVARVVAALGGGGVSVGCAAGADQAVVVAALAAGLPLSVFAVGSSSGAGFWSGSAPLSLLRSCPSVVWSAGGSAAVPFRARLLRRSLAALAGCSSLVLFLASPSSAGSLAVAGAAVSRGLPVFAFSCGFAGAPLAPRGCAGAWVACVVAGVSAWRWSPAGAQLALF
jgi:hypothetical protein